MSTRSALVVCGVVCLSALGCGSGAPVSESEAAGQAVEKVVSASANVIYGDALAAGWTDWSWATVNLASASPVASGTRSIAVTYAAWSGFYLHSGTPVPTAGLTGLELSVNGGTVAGANLNLYVTQNGTNLPAVKLAGYCAGGTIPANAWVRCKIPFSALGVAAGASIDGLVLQDQGGVARASLYLDDLAFTPALPAAPTGLAAAAGKAGVALTWSPTAGATGYQVLRASAAAGPFAAIGPAAVAAESYTDATAPAGATSWYQVKAVNAAGAGPASTAVSATMPAAAPTTSSVTVYGDALGTGWANWSWATTNLANASPVASGTRSIAVTYAAYSGLYLHGASAVSTAGLSSLALSIDGGTVAGATLNLYVTQGGANLPPVKLAGYCAGGTIPANAWARCTIPLSALGVASGASIDGIVLQDQSGVARATLYVDDVALTAGTSTTPAPVVAVAVAPHTATVAAGGSATFTASVTGTTNTAVTWSVQETGCGTVSTAGVYTAPAAAATCHVVARSAADTTKSDVATVTVSAPPPPATVTITPASGAVNGCQKLTFSASVSGGSTTGVTWSVQEGATGGSITSAGAYTAPATPGTYHVVATGASASSVAAVTVTEKITGVTVAPATVSLAAGATQAFVATVTTTCGSTTVTGP